MSDERHKACEWGTDQSITRLSVDYYELKKEEDYY
jgi:hypothetical protein